MRRGIGDIALAAYAVLVIAFLLAPVLLVLPMSLSESTVFELIPTRPSLSQYRRLFISPEWMEVLWRSVQIASIVMVIATIIGTLAAFGISRLSARARPFAEALFIAPQIVPSVVIAVSAYYVFAASGLVGTTVGIVIAHALIAVPFVVVLVRSRLQSIDPDLALASQSLGAGPAKTFLLITVPQLRLTLIGAAVLAFHVSFDEVVLALFLTGVRNKTLPVKLWDSILFEVTPILPAISTVVVAVPIIAILTVGLLRWRARPY
jgi:ABC-type spermidine/putrescine transport system permease subunit II